MADADDLLTTGEAAKLTGRSVVAFRQACERGKIGGAVSKGGIWLMPRHEAICYAQTAKRGRPPVRGQT